MAITLEDLARNAMAAALASSAAGGTIVIMTSTNTVLATLTLPNPAFGAPAAGTISANTIPAATASAAGTAAKYELRNSSNQKLLTGTVSDTAGSGDLKMASTSVSVGVEITINSFTYTMPAS